jgi:hypothetical protein
MAQITIDIPDNLAQQLAPFQSQFSNLFTRLIAVPLLEKPTLEQLNSSSPRTSSAYQEILDFLISRPTAKQIIDFKVSEYSQTHLQTLLQKNRETGLTSQEAAELDLSEQFDTLMGFLKIRAHAAFKQVSQN